MKIFCLVYVLVGVFPLFSFAQEEHDRTTKTTVRDAIVSERTIAPSLSDSTTLKLYIGTYYIGKTITGTTANIVLKNGNQLFLELPGVQDLILSPQKPRIFTVNDSSNTWIEFIADDRKVTKFIMTTSIGKYECLKK